MKFGKRLEEDLSEPQWEAHYVQYRVLKKVVKVLSLLAPDADAARITQALQLLPRKKKRIMRGLCDASVQCTLCKRWNVFVGLVLDDVSHVRAFLSATAHRLDAGYSGAIERSVSDLLREYKAAEEPMLRPGGAPVEVLARFGVFCDTLAALRRFVVVNDMALAKVIKKFRKRVLMSPAMRAVPDCGHECARAMLGALAAETRAARVAAGRAAGWEVGGLGGYSSTSDDDADEEEGDGLGAADSAAELASGSAPAVGQPWPAPDALAGAGGEVGDGVATTAAAAEAGAGAGAGAEAESAVPHGGVLSRKPLLRTLEQECASDWETMARLRAQAAALDARVMVASSVMHDFLLDHQAQLRAQRQQEKLARVEGRAEMLTRLTRHIDMDTNARPTHFLLVGVVLPLLTLAVTYSITSGMYVDEEQTLTVFQAHGFFISASIDRAPASNIGTLGLTTALQMLGVIIFVKHKLVKKQLRGRKWMLTHRVATALGLLSTFCGNGVAAFQHQFHAAAHNTFAALFFLLGMAHVVLETWIDARFRLSSPGTRRARVATAVTLVASVGGFLCPMAYVLTREEISHEDLMYWKAIAACFEVLGFACFIVWFASYYAIMQASMFKLDVQYRVQLDSTEDLNVLRHSRHHERQASMESLDALSAFMENDDDDGDGDDEADEGRSGRRHLDQDGDSSDDDDDDDGGGHLADAKDDDDEDEGALTGSTTDLSDDNLLFKDAQSTQWASLRQRRTALRQKRI